jgi:hypothetical protein
MLRHTKVIHPTKTMPRVNILYETGHGIPCVIIENPDIPPTPAKN